MFSQRRAGHLVTTNLPFTNGPIGSERLTGALLDRLTHHVNILEMNGDSYRLNQSLASNPDGELNRPPITLDPVSLPRGRRVSHEGTPRRAGALVDYGDKPQPKRSLLTPPRWSHPPFSIVREIQSRMRRSQNAR